MNWRERKNSYYQPEKDEKGYRPFDYVDSHGGWCCGRVHVHGLNISYWEKSKGYTKVTPQRFKSSLGSVLEKHKGLCVEVCLTKNQRSLSLPLTETGIAKVNIEDLMLEMGFKEVMTWTNPNSDNLVTCYLYSENEEKQ